MLMQLPHIAHMWNHGKTEFSRKQADRKKFADARKPGAVGLDVVDGRGLQKVLESDSIRNMLAGSDFDGSYFACQHGVSADIVRVCGLLDPGGLVDGELARHADCDRQTPALVS